MPAEILAAGEVLWDMLPTGRALGGAPCNFVFHCKQLGHQAAIISRVGADDLGRDARAELKAAGLDDTLIQDDPVHPTGTVDVTLSDGQPSYVIREGVAWDHLACPPEAEAALAHALVFCFGTLMQRHEASRAAVQHLARLAAQQMIVVCDINLRQHYHSPEVIESSLALSQWAKLNDEELEVLRTTFGLRGGTDAERVASLRKRFNLELVALTRGARGCYVQTDDDDVTLAGERVEVIDTVGAGDAFTAGLVCGVLEGMEVADAARLANRLAGRVAASRGGMPRVERP